MKNIKQKFCAAICATEHPLAPIIIQEAHAATNRLGALFVPISDKAAVAAHCEKLLANYPTNTDDYVKNPNYITALAALLSCALVEYGRSL